MNQRNTQEASPQNGVNSLIEEEPPSSHDSDVEMEYVEGNNESSSSGASNGFTNGYSRHQQDPLEQEEDMGKFYILIFRKIIFFNLFCLFQMSKATVLEKCVVVIPTQLKKCCFWEENCNK